MSARKPARPHPTPRLNRERLNSPSPLKEDGWSESRTGLVLILVLFVGLWLRWSLNGAWRLGPDESLYSTWARHIASGTDPWLARTPGVDKPPLLMYAIALSMTIYGFYEFASRFPNIIASTVSIFLTYLVAHRLYRRASIGLLAALLMALSPFAILYAPTAFADPLLVMLLLLAAVLAMSDRWALAGIAAGLAVLTKQETPLLLPAVAMLGLSAVAAVEMDKGKLATRVLRFAVVCALAAAGLEAAWESMRRGQPSPFAMGLAHYGGIGLVAPMEILPRLMVWWQDALRYVFVSPLLNTLLLVGAALLLARRVGGSGHDGREAGWHGYGADLALMLVVVYIVLARTLVSFQMWNRYMLVAVPFLCIVLARVIDTAWAWLSGAAARSGFSRLAQAAAPLALVATLLLSPVNDALAGRIPVGADHGLYWGIDDTARFVRENIAPGSVIYHYSLGWQLSYYLYGAHLDFWWYPSLEWLAATASSRAEQSQYIIVPSWEPGEEIASTLASHGLALLPVHTAIRPDGSTSFRTYRVAAASGSP